MSSFLSQLTVVPTSSFSHFHVPTNATSSATGLTSLNDVTIAHVSPTTATTTATKTQFPATRTATMNMPKYQLDKSKQLKLNTRQEAQAFCIPPRNRLTMQLQVSCCLLIRTTQQLCQWLTQVSCCLLIRTTQQLRRRLTHRIFCLMPKSAQQLRRQPIHRISCCFLFETIQPIPSFIWLLCSFEGLRLPKPPLILFQLWGENIKSLNSIERSKWNSVERSIKVSKRNSVERSKRNSIKWSKPNSVKWSKPNSIQGSI